MTLPGERLDPDPRLVRRAREGDRQALGELLRLSYPWIRRWALVRTGDAADADDVTQEVAVRLFEHLESYRGSARFSTWLYRVTRNAGTDLLRRRARRRERTVDVTRREGADELRQAPPGPGELDGRRAAELVRFLLEELPERQREVFDLADLQGFAPVEIGELLEMKPVSVRASLFKARRTIRRRILQSHPELVEEYGS